MRLRDDMSCIIWIYDNIKTYGKKTDTGSLKEVWVEKGLRISMLWRASRVESTKILNFI